MNYPLLASIHHFTASMIIIINLFFFGLVLFKQNELIENNKKTFKQILLYPLKFQILLGLFVAYNFLGGNFSILLNSENLVARAFWVKFVLVAFIVGLTVSTLIKLRKSQWQDNPSFKIKLAALNIIGIFLVLSGTFFQNNYL